MWAVSTKFFQWCSSVPCKYSLGRPVVSQCTLGQPVAFQWHYSVHWTSQCTLAQGKGYVAEMHHFVSHSLDRGYADKYVLNILRPKQNGRHFPDIIIFKWIFVNENARILNKISFKFVPRGPINNIPALVQTMAWRRPGDKPLSELLVVRLPTHTCVVRPQWFKYHNLAERNIPLCLA